MKGTGLLASTLARLQPHPDVFISVSAVGYYGDRGDDLLVFRKLLGRWPGMRHSRWCGR